MSYVIAEPCVNVMDKACVAACPVSCIYEAAPLGMLVIHPDECIDCGACVDPCPVKAIFPVDDLPEEWKKYAALNDEWFRTGEARTPAEPKA